MVKVVGVRFKKAGKVYYFDPAEFEINSGAKVVVETARGIEYGDVAIGPKDVTEDQVVPPLKKVLRIGTDRDASVASENKRKEKEAFVIAQKRIENHSLEMNLVDVEYTFDGSKVIFYFTAEGRVDFRELVRDLAGAFRTRIEMRQIGVRDEAKLLGGIGPCGRILCCTSFLGDFAPVSIRMAKDQNLSLNPSKISGLCGRLMCCLRYEQETYEAAKLDPTLAPGYVSPLVVSAEANLREVEELEERTSPRIGLRSDQTGYGAKIAQALNTTPERPPARPEGTRMEGPRPAGQQRHHGASKSPGGHGASPGQGQTGNRRERDSHSERAPGYKDRPNVGAGPGHTERRPSSQNQQPRAGSQPGKPGAAGDRSAGNRVHGAASQPGGPGAIQQQQSRRPQPPNQQGKRPANQPHPSGGVGPQLTPAGSEARVDQEARPQGERSNRRRRRNRSRGGQRPDGSSNPNTAE